MLKLIVRMWRKRNPLHSDPGSLSHIIWTKACRLSAKVKCNARAHLCVVLMSCFFRFSQGSQGITVFNKSISSSRLLPRGFLCNSINTPGVNSLFSLSGHNTIETRPDKEAQRCKTVRGVQLAASSTRSWMLLRGTR